jgi:serine/threonine-protein kinase
VITGSVRRGGSRIRVNVQLIDVVTGNAAWSEEYQRDLADVLDVQDDIARRIVSALRVNFANGVGAPLAGTGTRSAVAFDFYLKGRSAYHLATPQSLFQAEMLFKRAIASDGSYARAYAGLADTYTWMAASGYIKRDTGAQPATEAAAAALRLDSASAEVNTSFGFAHLFFHWDFAGAQRAAERAIALDPFYVPARRLRGYVYLAFNQLDSAVIAVRQGAEIEPMSVVMSAQVGRMLLLAGRHVDALVAFQKTLALDSTSAWVHAQMAAALVALNRCDDALRELPWLRYFMHTFEGVSLGYLLASCQRETTARAMAANLEARASQEPAAAVTLAGVYGSLGEKDKALAWLERAYRERTPSLFMIRGEPGLAALRSEQRFQAIVARIGLR